MFCATFLLRLTEAFDAWQSRLSRLRTAGLSLLLASVWSTNSVPSVVSALSENDTKLGLPRFSNLLGPGVDDSTELDVAILRETLWTHERFFYS